MKTIFLIFLTLIITSVHAASKHDIEIKKFKFSPAEITIEIGDTIRWTNKEKRQYHSVWFEALGEPIPDYFFPDEFYEKTFDEAGDFPYRCEPHPKMKGIVHVTSKKTVLAKKTEYLVESVEDGDTIVIQYKGKSQRVQLIGIDAPEDTENPKLNLDSKIKQLSKTDLLEMGLQSTNFLKGLVKKGDTVLLEGNLTQKDKYDRLPAIVVNKDKQSLNEKMVENGYAVLLTRFPLITTFKSKLEKLGKKALEDKKGLWKSHYENMEKWSRH